MLNPIAHCGVENWNTNVSFFGTPDRIYTFVKYSDILKAILVCSTVMAISMSAVAQQQAPRAAKKNHEVQIHGKTWDDPYFWLRNREEKEVLDYLNAENAWTKKQMQSTEALQSTLFKEMKSRIKETDMSVPYTLRGYEYYVRFEEGKEYPVYCRKKTGSSTEEIMLNANELAKGKSYFDLQGLSVSPDNKLIAFGTDTVSRRKYTLHIKNLETGEIYAENIPNTDGSYVWANDNRTIFYDVKDDETLRTFLIRKHVLGTTASEDSDVYKETDETFNCGVFKSKSEEYIFIASFSTLTSEVSYLKADKPESGFKVIQPRERNLLYQAEHLGDNFYIRTNLDAKNFRLVSAPVNQCSKENWKDVRAHNPSVFFEGFELFRKYMVYEERENGLIKFRVLSYDGKTDRYISFNEPVYTAYPQVNPNFDTDKFRYGYTSLISPSSVYDYDMNTGTSVLLKQQEVPGGYNASDYESVRLWAKASDGTSIPMSVVYKKGMQRDGKNNLLLYGYGSYGYSLDPSFSVASPSLLDRGFVYVIAHIRGGQELGRQWYEDGKLLKKRNTFTDFIDCAEYLIKEKYTSPEHLYAMGGSAGGLLMGAVVNMRPDLWKGVVAQVPFVDVIHTMLDESIPLTTGEFDEWGNPKDPVYFDYIRSYSPYDNVQAKNYPNMLVTTGLHDSQVQYWEPAKWVARLRELKTDRNELLLYTEMEAGHGGKSGRFERLKEVAMEYAFILKLAGINK